MKIDFAKAKQNMIDCQIRPFSVIDEGVIDAFTTVDREVFVANDQRPFAYSDEDLNLGQGRFLMDPAVFARLLQELNVQSGDQILDLGCGCGYSSTILTFLGASVTAADKGYWVAQSKENSIGSDKKAMRWVEVDDIGRGCGEYGPYDAIVINGAVEQPPQHLAEQLRDGGKIATVYRDEKGVSQAVLFIKHGDNLTCQRLFDAFVPVLPEFAKKDRFQF